MCSVGFLSFHFFHPIVPIIHPMALKEQHASDDEGFVDKGL